MLRKKGLVGLLCLALLFSLPCFAHTANTAGKSVGVSYGASYLDRDHVAAYIMLFGELPPNYLTKEQARDLGWTGARGSLWKVAPGAAIGGDYFGNYEGQLPKGNYTECDVDYDGRTRNEKRLIFDRKGHVYYTGDHYNTFTLMQLDAYALDMALITEDGEYLDRESVAYYLAEFGHLPANYLTKSEARDLGWTGNKDDLWRVAPDRAIGGDPFRNAEGLLPEGEYRECDVDYAGGPRGQSRLIYDIEGNIYYTEDRYQSFIQLYGLEE